MVSVKNIKLNNSVKIPVVGLGTWKLQGDQGIQVMKSALRLGYRHFDTAEMYNTEIELGKAIKGFDRSKLFIVSKVSPWNLSHRRVISSFEGSISRMGTDYLDLYLIHWPPPFANWSKVLEAFKELYDKRKIRAFGVSNFKVKHLERIIPICKKIDLPISVNQIEFNPLVYPREVFEYCKRKGIVVTAYSPLAKGNFADSDLLNNLALKYKKSVPQIVLRWLLDCGLVVIPKSSSEAHLKENISLFDFKIDIKDARRIDSMSD